MPVSVFTVNKELSSTTHQNLYTTCAQCAPSALPRWRGTGVAARDEAVQPRPLCEQHHQGGGRGSLLDLGPGGGRGRLLALEAARVEQSSLLPPRRLCCFSGCRHSKLPLPSLVHLCRCCSVSVYTACASSASNKTARRASCRRTLRPLGGVGWGDCESAIHRRATLELYTRIKLPSCEKKKRVRQTR